MAEPGSGLSHHHLAMFKGGDEILGVQLQLLQTHLFQLLV